MKTKTHKSPPRFDLGRVIITPSASSAIEGIGQSVDQLLARHQAGDWGDVSDQERHVNDLAIAEQCNIVSIYPAADSQRVTITTNSDRTLTFVHLDPRHS